MKLTNLNQLFKRHAVTVLLLGAACISVAPIFVRVSEVGPSATAFYRLLLALPVLWLWMSRDQKQDHRHRRPQSWRDYGRLMVAGLFFTGDISLWHWSITLTSVANSTLLVNLAPIFVTLGGYLFFRERVTRIFVLGMVCAVIGMFVLLGDSFTISPTHIFGDIIAICAAVFYGAYILTVGRLRSDFSTATVLTWTSAVSCIMLIPIVILTGESFAVLTLQGWLVLIGLALISHVIGQGLITYSLAHLPASFGSVGLLLQPVLAALLAWYLFQEALSTFQLVGGMIVLAGIYIARRGK